MSHLHDMIGQMSPEETRLRQRLNSLNRQLADLEREKQKLEDQKMCVERRLLSIKLEDNDMEP